MNSIKWLLALILAAVGLYFVLMNDAPLEKPTESDTSQTGVEVKKRYDEKGNLKSDVEIVNGVRNGVAHNYYDDGSLHSEIRYKNGIKEGNSIWYFENGNPYRITPFVNGKKEGMQQKYYDNGQLMAEIPYKNNQIQPGTKEYSKYGKLLQEYPQYKVSLKRVATDLFYQVKIEGKKLSKITDCKLVYSSQGKQEVINGTSSESGLYLFKIDKGSIEGNTLLVWLHIKTDLNNSKVIEKKVAFSL